VGRAGALEGPLASGAREREVTERRPVLGPSARAAWRSCGAQGGEGRRRVGSPLRRYARAPFAAQRRWTEGASGAGARACIGSQLTAEHVRRRDGRKRLVAPSGRWCAWPPCTAWRRQPEGWGACMRRVPADGHDAPERADGRARVVAPRGRWCWCAREPVTAWRHRPGRARQCVRRSLTATTLPTRPMTSAARPAGTACRVRLMPTLPKYTART
jgi:hypothetical protein